MKHLKFYTILLFCSVFASNTFAQSAGKDLFEVKVDGLGCPFCAYGLEKKFKEFKGIKDIKIEMETGDFSFSLPADQALDLVSVEKQVDAAGYTAVTMKVSRANGTVEAKEVSVSKNFNKNNLVKATLYVEGKCKMCRARINKAVKSVEGVADANWDDKTKILSYSYDKALTNEDEIERKVVAVGHDTRNISASDDVYKSLPACCMYKRIKRDK